MARAVLLVEGKDDEHVVRHLCRAHGIDLTACDIEQPQGAGTYSNAGVDVLLDQVPLRLRTDLERLAVIVDADEDAARRWTQLRDRLHAAGYGAIPDMPDPAGTIVPLDRATRTVRFGAWIMPNNALPGMLETFLVLLAPPGDKMLPHVDRFLSGIPEEDRLFSPVHLPKARIHSFLAVQEAPGKPLGTAINARFLAPDRTEIVGPFLAWLRKALLE